MSLVYPSSLFAGRALLRDGWAGDVRLDIGADGRIAAIAVGAEPAGAERVAGPLVPAMPNLHSHAFQYVMAGQAEVAGSSADSFWTWRDVMYRIAGLLSPEDAGAVAAKLYVEMLKGGYGAVGEFHYLHHAAGGGAYDDPAEMSLRIADAARRAGIGLTLLPVFYAHSDFGGAPPQERQARFVHSPDAFLSLLERLRTELGTTATLGLAFHSLRAATPGEMRAILGAGLASGPIHIHAAEQTAEVEACLAWSGRRPVRLLLDEIGAGKGWCLIHATHLEDGEVRDLAASGAVVGLCPATEANLGDGIFPAEAYLGKAGSFGIGSDSQVATSVAEELRMLEYGQRLQARRRNVLAGGPDRSTGRRLFDAALDGGVTALGAASGGRIAVGAPASFTVLDGDDAFIATSEGDRVLDRWIFARGSKVVRDVMVAGRWVIRDRRHANAEAIDRDFRAALDRLASA
ncbi:formimidoylglutamate deiminase [Aureimonas sp. SA4125]|uniref:formimidoylglutamate deiminase n=1 Tax=Aureimonas sp. SA4125 TaxID=2826993 RepID=UPI001CC49A83|nr:formimidoylglutamate deiminase [Aureimonas sp. SA4125]BDA85266.1 formimidoylglutamate deiminase [Aureimonas sp. SA4125]